MKIAQVAPLWETIPPTTYGGIELVVSLLTEELVQRGHDVTLFASGDSSTNARLKATSHRSLRQSSIAGEYDFYEQLQLCRVYEQQNSFDIIHFHDKCASLSLAQRLDTPTIRTLHYAFTRGSMSLFEKYHQLPYISISNAQRKLMPHMNYLRTVYNGIDFSQYPFASQPQDPPHLAFLGRMSPDKGPQYAIKIAKKVGLPIKLAGKIDTCDQPFFDQEIATQIDGEKVIFLGEVNHAQKVELLGQASATLFPISWCEPFGLVMIESMAVGTPVIGINLGSVPEVIAHKQSGFVCRDFEEMADKVPAALELERSRCRQYAESKFGIKQMVDGYEAAYQEILANA
jgi:glycosyltransferase involved in cell wall biosynthesis